MTARPRIGFAGMSHLGLNSAIASADKDFDILCYDPDAALIAELKASRWPVSEPGLPEMAAKNAARLSFSADLGALATCDVVYVALDVATDDAGTADFGPLRALIAQVDAALARDAAMVVLSQVQPGFTRSLPRDKRHLFYQVETLIFGRAIERAAQPERFILGLADPAAPLPAAWRVYLEAFGCPLLPMRFESAELAKIAINCCLVASVSVANTLAEVSEGIGADWAEIVPALRLDRRIGQYSYINPGLGISGGNLERDLAAVVAMGDRTGADVGVVRAWMANSRYRKDWALRCLQQRLVARVAEPSLGLLGLAYKEDTHSIKNSPAVALLRALPGIRLKAYDPEVKAIPGLPAAHSIVASPEAACAGADAVAIMTPWRQFRALDLAALAGALRGPKLLVDPFRIADGAAARALGLEYHTLGTR